MAAKELDGEGMHAFPLQISEVRALKAHRLHSVKMLEPAICRVSFGIKRVFIGSQKMEVGSGELLLLPAQVPVNIDNEPDSRGYFAQVLSFPRRLLSEFHLSHSKYLPPQTEKRQIASWRIEHDVRLDAAWERVILSCRENEPDILQQHLLYEVLVILGLRGLLWPLLSHVESSLMERLHVFLMSSQPSEWTQEKAAESFHVSIATLRRHLTAEGHSFRELVDEYRMLLALHQVQTSLKAIDTIADACGYASTARFSSRFRIHFGITPHTLRKTLVGSAPIRRSR